MDNVYVDVASLLANVTNVSGDVIDNSNNNGVNVVGSNVGGSITNVTTVDNSTNITDSFNDNHVDNSTTIIKEGDTYTYSGGNRTITNYQQGEKIMLASDYQGIGINGNTFLVNSSSGALEIQECRDKFVEYTVSDGSTAAYSYLGGSEGAIDGRDKAQAEIMIGADNADNQIYAGNGGSSVWGGNGGNDVLTGGDGYDEFFYAIGSGNDVIQNSSSNDIINLLGVTLEDISGVNVNIGQVNLNFVDGGNLTIEGNTGVGYKLGDEIYTVDQSTNEWSIKQQ